MTAIATWMMGRWMKRGKLPKIPEIIQMCKGMNVELLACSTTMGVMGIEQGELIEGCEISGAAAFLDFAAEAEVQLFI